MRIEGQLEPLVTGYDSPEGPAFASDGALFFVNWLSSSILRLPLGGPAEQWFNTGGIPAGLAFHRDGSLYVADEGDRIHGVLRINPARQSRLVVNQHLGDPLNGANDLVFDYEGVLYFSDPWGSSLDDPIGGFYRLFPDGRLDRIDRGLAFPNGVAFDASYLYLAETLHNRVLRYPRRPDGAIGPREEWCQLEGPNGPDGMAFDVEGSLYVAHFGAGRVDVIDQSGLVFDQIAVPGSKPTNVAFGGPDNRTLVVTEVETASVYHARALVPGAPLWWQP
ncbi:MAG TPA: SMP-30/gluconolactonase/LRE family protein [Chloroflexota bacterium]